MDASDMMKEKLDEEVSNWISDSDEILWEDVHRFPDGFLQRHLLAVDRDEGKVTVIRAWMASPDSPPCVSVDMSMSFEAFAGQITEEDFPRSGNRGDDLLERAFRSQLLGEHAEMVWQSSDGYHATFIARTAKVGRDEHVVAGSVTIVDGKATPEIAFRTELASLKPEARRARPASIASWR